MAASYESDLAKRNAALETERARDSIDRGRDEARTFYRQVGQTKGQQIASMAANGIDVSEGTALTIQQDTATGAEEDAANLYRNVHERTRGFDINASNFRAEAAAARARGKSALVNSFFEAGSSLMGGFQQNRAMQARMGIGRSSGGSYLSRAAASYRGG